MKSSFISPLIYLASGIAVGTFSMHFFATTTSLSKSNTRTPNSEQSSTPEIASIKTSKNTYELLPCPSKEETVKLFERVNLSIADSPEDATECALTPKGKIARLLHFMNASGIEPAAWWPQYLQDDIKKSFDTLSRYSKKLSLDLSQTDSVAYNKTQLQEIYLGNKFLSLEPLDALSVLIHEARHSEKNAPSHVTCRAGDLPLSGGACDRKLSVINEECGAYSYGALLHAAIALYSDEFSAGDREFSMVEALTLVGNRFNELPDSWSEKRDGLALLTDKGEILWSVRSFSSLDSYNKISIPNSDIVGKPVRIEFFPSQNGILIFTDKKRVLTWSPLRGVKKFYESVVTENMQIEDAARIYVPFLEHTAFTYREVGGSLSYIDYSASLDKRIRVDYPIDTPKRSHPVPDIQRMFLSFFGDSLFIDSNGVVYLAPHFGGEEAFRNLPVLQTEDGWSQGTGGAFYDSAYLVSKKGNLSIGVARFEVPDGGEVDERVHSLESSKFISHKVTKFSQGLRFASAVSNEGELLVAEAPSFDWHVTPTADKIKDVVIFHTSAIKSDPSSVPH